MTAFRRHLGAVSLAAMLSACGNDPGGAETLGTTREAVNACVETAPANRAVDGFPAYAQCAGVENGAIWSNNGIDTATSSQGAGWVRTQNSGGYQCTEFARRYFIFHWGIDYQHGNAGEWCDGTLPSTLARATSPSHGDLMVFAPGSCGADATTGHIAVVDTVNQASGKVTIVEQNQASRRATDQSCAKCYLHAVKNDGSAGSSSGGGAAGGSAGGLASAGGGSGGFASGGGASGGAAPGGSGESGSGGAGLVGSGSGGSSPVSAAASGASSGDAGSVSLPSGGNASAGSSSSSAPASNPSPTPSSADDAGCNVSRAGSSTSGLAGAALVLAYIGRLRRRRAR